MVSILAFHGTNSPSMAHTCLSRHITRLLRNTSSCRSTYFPSTAHTPPAEHNLLWPQISTSMTHNRLPWQTKPLKQTYSPYGTYSPFTTIVSVFHGNHIHLLWHAFTLYGIFVSHGTNIPFIAHVASHGKNRLPRDISAFYDTYPPLTVQIVFYDTYLPYTAQRLLRNKLAFHGIYSPCRAYIDKASKIFLIKAGTTTSP